ncbi:MAG: PAS domain S-box protein, partial [Burkholderiales bacterium]
MSATTPGCTSLDKAIAAAAPAHGMLPAEALLKTASLQSAILYNPHLSLIATDEKGVIQLFNIGAERLLGYAAAEMVNQATPAHFSEPPDVMARAVLLSREFGTPIAPGFEALVFKAAREIDDIYELNCMRKDGSRVPLLVAVTALRDAGGAIIGYLLICTDNLERKAIEEKLR